jgi:ABC-type transporter Mla subunit MlaD
MPLTAARPAPVEFDEFINTFDEPTRTASQKNLVGFGDAFAGRGPSLNQAIGALRPLLRDIVPVAQNLSDPNTGLRRFIGSLSDAARIVAPAAESQAQLFVNLDTTFSALSEVKPFIQESISEGPETLDTAIAEFPKQRPFLANTEGLFRELKPGADALRRAAPDLADALVAGTRTLPKTPPFNRQVADLLQTLQEFSEDPLVPQGIRRLTELANSLNPTLAFLAPAQLQCNYVTLWFRNVSSLLSVGDRNGTWQRFIIIATPQGPNNEGTPSSAPANGPTAENHFHINPYPHTASPGQPKECEAGNEPYAVGRTVLSNPPGTQSATTEDTSK